MLDSISINSIIITCLLILTMPCSYGSNDTTQGFYNICHSLLYSCGPVKNLGYPFWGDNRPEFCGGKPEFKLSCWNHGSLPHIHGNLQVLNVMQSSETLLVSLGDEFTCWERYKSSLLNFSSLFKLGPSVLNLSLYPDNCFRPFNDKQCKMFSCLSSNLSQSIVYRRYCNIDNREGEMGNFSEFCKGSRIEVPVFNTSLYWMKDGRSALESVFEKGFELEYTVPHINDCTVCQNTGGTCGSSGNPSWEFKCYYPKRGKKIPQWLILGLGITGGIVIIFTLAYKWYCKRYKSHSRSVSINGSFEHMTSNHEEGCIYFHVPLFSYRELEEATSKFDASKELGSGGFGRVYYGKVRDGREVAVKRLYENSYRRINQFMNEVKILTSLRHQHLVSLYGCTPLNSIELFLVYEYVPNGTVADHLFGNKSQSHTLHWHVRMKIAIETAIALSYLHLSDIIHRDVKTNNILLDNNFSVKVADFGLSRLFPNDVTHVSTAPQGTPGYVDPEYHQCYQLTKKSDVYSFGVVLIELLSSLPAVDTNRLRHEINLSSYAIDRIKRCAFDELVDPELGFGRDPNIRKMTISVAELAFRCLQHDRDFRPTMDEVLAELKKIESAYSDEMRKKEVNQEDDGARLLDTRQKHLSSREKHILNGISTKLTTSNKDVKLLTSYQTI